MMSNGSMQQQGGTPPALQAQKMQQTSLLAAATSVQPEEMVWICGLLQLPACLAVKLCMMLPKMQAPPAKPIWAPSLLSCLPLGPRCASTQQHDTTALLKA